MVLCAADKKKEKQVYQKFEKALIDKLGFLVNKQIEAGQTGGLRNAFQLASSYKKFNQTEDKKSIKQSGFLFYIPAWKTSKIDPVTGFVNLLDTRYQNAEKSRAFFAKFDSIRYNKEKNWFEFAFDYNNFGKKGEGTRTEWTLCTYGTRIRQSKNSLNKWDDEKVELTSKFKDIFEDASIDIHENLKEAICSLDGKHLEQLMRLMKLLLQLRNSKIKSDTDYLLSPVADENGKFYDSRTCGSSLPENADANGAYNIARKGLMLIEQIKASDDLAKLKFDISNKSWLNFAQQKPYKDE